IASQAVISGAFSLSRQAIQLGLMPPLDLFQTSTRARGQIYIPQVNWLLLIAVLALVLGFQSSSALASAYGFAVTGTMTITTVLATCEEAPEARVSGTAVFLTTQTENVPLILLNNLKHNKVLHRTVLLVRVITENIPRVASADRIKARELGSGFWQIEAHFGFAQTPNVPRELGRAGIPGLELDPSQLSFFVGRANVKSTSRPGMARWHERLYSGLARLATRSTDFFRIPPDRVIELGAEVEI